MRSTRRSFLQGMGFSAAALAAGCRCPFGQGAVPIALQLYSIHKIFWDAPERILAELKAGGYDGVEFAGYGGRAAKEIAKLLKDAGLRGAGTHVNGNVDLVGDGLKRTLDFCAEAGLESVVTPHAQRNSAAEYVRFGHDMGLAAEAAASYGIKVGIHTTYHHFKTKYDGVQAWDLMFQDASPLLQQQVDTSNTFNTGTDVVALLRKYPERHHSIHAKENVPTVDGTFGVPPTDGGACVPWADVIAYMKTERTQKWWIVEAEGKPAELGPALASQRILASWL